MGMIQRTGGNLVYAPVDAVAVSARNAIPSNVTIVDNVYYSWNENGFVGVSWFFNISGSPMVNAGLTSEELVEEYFNDHTDLNDVFDAWHPDKKEFDDFYNAVKDNAYNCYDIV